MLTDYQSLRAELQHALSDPGLLPVRQAARESFSPGLAYGRHFGPAAPTARQAAVLVLLEPRDDQWTIPLTVRSDHLPDHPGQVSLPGGRLEAGESHREAAEREFLEELGSPLEPDQILGELLPLYVYHSDYFVRCYLAVSPQLYEYLPCDREVARVLHLPVTAIALEADRHRQEFSRGLVVWTAPTIQGAGASIWGATAIILAEVAVLLGSYANTPPERTDLQRLQ